MKFITWKQRILVFFITLLVIGGFALVGYMVGRLVNNVALLVMLAVIISYPFTMWTLARVMHRDFEKRAKKELDQK